MNEDLKTESIEKDSTENEKNTKGINIKKKLGGAFADVKDYVGARAGDAAVVIKKGKDVAAQKAEAVAADFQRQMLRPVFDESLQSKGFPDVIRVCEPDKQHQDSPVCQNAVGHYVATKDMNVLNLYMDNASNYGLSFYPSLAEDVYYRHPFNENRYISLDEYFYQLKKEKVDELLQIAQSLGAKYVKITLMAEKKSFTGASAKASAKGPTKGKDQKKDVIKAETGINADYSSKTLIDVEVSAETKFKGHLPTPPELKYFSNEHDIQTLINMRMNDPNDLHEQTYTIKYSNSSKIKAATAAKLDVALKKMKLLNANASVSAEIEDESRLYYKYHIEFPTAEELE